MASAYNNNMCSYYTFLNNKRIQVIVHQPTEIMNKYKSETSPPSSIGTGVAMSRNSSGFFSSGLSTPIASFASNAGNMSPHSPQLTEAFSLIKGKVMNAVDNLVNDYSLPTTIHDIKKEKPLFQIINEILTEYSSDEDSNKNIKKYWDVEAQEEIYEVLPYF